MRENIEKLIFMTLPLWYTGLIVLWLVVTS